MFVSFLLINEHLDARFQNQNTHAPFGGVPGCEPPGEGGRLKSLLDKDDGGVWVSGAWVGAQVLLARDHCFFALYFIGLFTNPEEHLRPTTRKDRAGINWFKIFLKNNSLSTQCQFIPGPMCPAALRRPHWGHPAWTESPRLLWNGLSYWSIQTGVVGGPGPSAVIWGQQVCHLCCNTH